MADNQTDSLTVLFQILTAISLILVTLLILESKKDIKELKQQIQHCEVKR